MHEGPKLEKRTLNNADDAGPLGQIISNMGVPFLLLPLLMGGLSLAFEFCLWGGVNLAMCVLLTGD